MPYQEKFEVEEYMDEYETSIEYNLAETCCYSMSLNDVEKVSGEKFELDYDTRFTYGAIDGSEPLRELIAGLYSNEDVEITKDNVLITNGAIGANFLTYYTLFGKGDHVICVAPTYQQLFSVPKMFGADVDLLHLKKEDGFVPSLDELTKLIKENTKAIILNSPNNPLGSVIGTDLLQKINGIAESHGITVLCDEVYRPLFHSVEDAPKSIVQLSSKGISTGSMSKAFAFAGVRLGWIVSQDLEFLKAAKARRHYNTISVSMIDDQLSQYVLRNKEAVLQRNNQLCSTNLAYLKQWVSESKFAEFYNVPQGGSVCLIKFNGIPDTYQFTCWLAKMKKVLLVPGETFQCPGTVRLGYANSYKELVKGLDILTASVDDYFKEFK
ncbi:hypothetical protein ACO0QE_004369 [Hanseniaspora vineae]